MTVISVKAHDLLCRTEPPLPKSKEVLEKQTSGSAFESSNNPKKVLTQHASSLIAQSLFDLMLQTLGHLTK